MIITSPATSYTLGWTKKPGELFYSLWKHTILLKNAYALNKGMNVSSVTCDHRSR